MDDFYLPLDEPSEGGFEPNTNQQAFAAYEEAWVERDSTGSTNPDLLIAALRRRQVPARAYAAGTRLHRALFDSWRDGRRPKRMHGVILKYRFGKLRGARIDDADTGIELPADLRPASRWSLRDEEELPFRPTGLFAARLPAWYDAAEDEDDDDDDPERYIPVWCDTAARPEQTPVMIGRELAGHTDLPEWAHRQVAGAVKRGRRVVITGDLLVKRRKNGTLKVKTLDVALPKRKT